MNFFVPKDVTRFVGITYRQMQYWDTTGLIKPSHQRKNRYRLYTFADLVLLKTVSVLRVNGYSIQKIRRTVTVLQELLLLMPHPLDDLVFLFDGGRVTVCSGSVLQSTSKGCVIFYVRKLRDEVDKV